MKKLVLLQQNPNLENDPTPAEITAWVKETAAYMKKISNSAQGQSPFFFKQGRGGGMILETDSASEMKALIEGVPISPICTVATYPIVDPETFVESLNGMFTSSPPSGGSPGRKLKPGAKS